MVDVSRVFDCVQLLPSLGGFVLDFPVSCLHPGCWECHYLLVLWSADIWDYMVAVLTPFIQWFLANPLLLIPFFLDNASGRSCGIAALFMVSC